MGIKINNKFIEINEEDKNLIETARRAKIGIPGPCYRSRSKGCCKVCVVEINGELGYACCTKPVEGMVVITDRPDIRALQKENLEKYRRNLNDPLYNGDCDCSCDCSPEGSIRGCC